ncbi:MAG: hypothetical protein JO314_07845 [Acidobacteria bacterium]|nr:hypothetical protein [Acidobacteriota bacterium]
MNRFLLSFSLVIGSAVGFVTFGQHCKVVERPVASIDSEYPVNQQARELHLFAASLKACPQNKGYIVSRFRRDVSKRSREKYVAEVKRYLLSFGLEEKRLVFYPGRIAPTTLVDFYVAP